MKRAPIFLLLIFLCGCSINSTNFTEYKINRGVASNAKIRDIVGHISKKYDLKEETDLPATSPTIIYCSNLGLFSIIAIRALNDENIIIVNLREGKFGSAPSEKYTEIKKDLTRELKDSFGDLVIIDNKTD